MTVTTVLDRVRKATPLDRLLYFIKERESVRIKKELGLPAPWTDDPILRKYRFCNVRRMDDKVSRWLLRTWYRPYRDHPSGVAACLLARQLNRIETLAAVGFQIKWDAGKVVSTLEDMQRRGLKVFSAAYMITGTLGGTKVEQVVNKVVTPMFRNLPTDLDTSSMESCHASLVGRPGIQSFMAGQIVADLRWMWTGKWFDKKTWAPLGPGSRRGLNRLYGFEPKLTGHTSEEFQSMLQDTIGVLYGNLPTELASRLEAMDLQNTLCEWDKYERALHGQGKPKQLYRPIENRQ